MSRPHNPPAPYILRHWENFINYSHCIVPSHIWPQRTVRCTAYMHALLRTLRIVQIKTARISDDKDRSLCMIECNSLSPDQTVHRIPYMHLSAHIAWNWENFNCIACHCTENIVTPYGLTSKDRSLYSTSPNLANCSNDFLTARIVPSQQMTTRIVRWSSTSANLANCSNDFKLQGSCLLSGRRQGSICMALLDSVPFSSSSGHAVMQEI